MALIPRAAPLRRVVATALVATWLVLPLPAVRASVVPPSAASSVSSAAPLPSAGFAHRLSSEVYGFLPYWEVDAGTDAYLRYDLLTDIALFSLSLNADGSIDTTTSGYAMVTGATVDTIVAHAHAAGVRVDVTLTSFGLTKNSAFFTNPSAMAAGTANLAALVAAHGFDGIDVDVELLANADFAAYGGFVGGLRNALRASNPDARVSVATNANLSGAGMASQAIANGADRAFIMGYSYRTAGSSPVGSIDPLARSDGGLTLAATLDSYASMGIPANRLLLGLPYYGWTWKTDSGNLHATNLGSVGAFFPGTGITAIPAGTTVQTDPVERSRWFARQDATTGAWTETYYDDPSTLAPKYGLAASRGLAGVGIWALGYDRPLTSYWDQISASFGTIRLSGADRYATAAAISTTFAPGVDTAFVATGRDFPDAVAGAAAAAHLGSPLLLVDSGIPASTASALSRLRPARIVVLGGSSVVSDAIAAALVPYASSGSVVRAAGSDRYGTSAAVSRLAYPGGAPVVYLATGTNFPDALAAGPAAAHDGGPVLLTDPLALSPATAAELTRLAPTRVVIAGSTGAVSAAVESAVHALVPSAAIDRRGGADRYATAALLAGSFVARVASVYVATGLDFPDALSAGAAAGAQDGPLLLTTTTLLPGVSTSTIVALSPSHAVIAGGPSVVSDGVLAAVRNAVATAP